MAVAAAGAAVGGVRDATRPAPSCPQVASFAEDTPSVDEDCLKLNVTAPKPRPGHRSPVLVFLHPGGFTQGASRTYGAARLATEGDLVVVTVNYRLGVLGFLAHPALDAGSSELSGNYGLEDQQAALRWVRRNAAAFGGDPGNVTLSGASAGGISTCAQLLSPSAAGLFDRAIIESGPCPLTTKWAYPNVFFGTPRPDAEKAGQELAAKLGCPGPATAAACLRAEPVSALIDPAVDEAAGPTIGGGVLPLPTAKAVAEGRLAKIPVMQGTSRDEVRLHAAAEESFGVAPRNEAEYQARLESDFGVGPAAKILEHYPLSDYGSPSVAWATVVTDRTWSCSVLRTDRALSSRIPVYAYEFADLQAPWTTTTPPPTFPTGAFHTAELQYLYEDGQFTAALTQPQRALSATMIRYWSAFAHTGNPNTAGTPRWPRFTSGGSYVQSLAPSGIGDVDLGREHQCGFWNGL